MKPSIVETNLVGVPEFDVMDAAAAESVVRPSCPSERWVAYLVRTRPHKTFGQLVSASDDAVRLLDWPDIEQAIVWLPASWERPALRRREAARPRPDTPAETRSGLPSSAAVRSATVAYQERFGHPFLTSTPGGSAGDVLHQLHLRLTHEADVERRVVRAELRRVVRLRLSTTFCALDGC